MNSETLRPMPPRCFSRRRNEISVTPAIGESTSGGLISISRILNGLISLMKKPHEILPHVAVETGAQAFRLLSSGTINDGRQAGRLRSSHYLKSYQLTIS